MSITVAISEDGIEKIYFRMVEEDDGLYVERPDKPSIFIAGLVFPRTLEDQVISALESIQKEDDKWANIFDLNI